MSWIISFFQSVFGNFWETLTKWALMLIMGPVAFFLFGPLFKLSNKIAITLLDQLTPMLGSVGYTATGLMGWFVDKMRIQECITAFMTFLILGMVISLIKKVF